MSQLLLLPYNTSGLTNTDVYTSTTAGSLSATVKENNNNTIISGATVTWSSSNTDVATIDNSGAVTLVAAGTTTITASYAGGNGYGSSSATYELTVTSSEPYVQPTTIEIVPNYEFWGKTGQFSGSTYSELEGSQDNVSLYWTRGNGSTYANSTAMRFYKDNNLTFSAPEGYEIISIVITFTTAKDDLSFSPEGYSLSGTTGTWTGSSATVTMSRPSNADSYAQISKFTITLAPIGSAVTTTTTINVPANFNTDIYQGTNAGTLTATVKDNDDNAISGATVTWSSSNTGVATINANGEVTLVAVGTTTITASYAGVEDEYRPSSGTYELTVTSSEPIPGTQAMPYTVAQARAAIDAGTGTQGVYATGIVTEIVDAYSQQYHNVTFNFIDEGVTSVFLQAYRCVSGTGVDASTVAVGDVVVVYGNLTKYGSTYEFGQGCQLVSLTHPDILAPTFSVTAGGYAEAQSVELSCETENALIYYTLNGDNPTNASTPYNGAISVSETTTIKAVAYVGTGHSPVAEAAYYILSDDNVYTVTEALEFGDYPANNVFVHGIVSTAAESLSSGALTYYISVDGNNSDELEVYKGKGLNNVAFTSVDDIQEGDIVTIFGNVIVYGNDQVIEFASGNYLVSFERPAQQYTLTVTCSENVEIFTFVGESTDPGVEGSTTLQVTNGTEVGLSVSVSEGYVLTLMVDGENVTSDLDDTGYYTFSMPAHAVTVTATAVEDVPPTPGDKYVKVTSAADLTSGQYLIVYEEGTVAFDGSLTTLDATSNIIEVVISNNEIAVNTTTTASEFTIDVTAGTIKSASGYYIGRTASSNGMNYSESEAYTNTISIVDNNAVITSSEGPTLRFNDASNQNRFRYYGSGQKAIQLYKKVVAEETYTLTIPAFNSQNGGYRLISSPVATATNPTNPENVTHMITDDDDNNNRTYDLYRFDQAQELEWRNSRNSDGGGFSLEFGKGYLYGNLSDVELVFTGTAITSGSQTVTLGYTEGAEFAGWNLVGNPFGVNAYIGNRDFYVMEAGSEIILADRVQEGAEYIKPMEGVFVIAANKNDKELQFTTTPNGKSSRLGLNLNYGRKVIDRAMVRFDDAQQLPKFQLNRNSTKLYIPQDGKDFAVVCAEEMGAMPVNFKAEDNGTYSLNFSCENVEFSYLHLIDNMTGNDIDLLKTPSYSFEAKTTDYANRFKLVFATGDNNGEDFAFFSNGSFVINNEGNATLQMIDVTGRIISTENINGCANVNVNAAPGVYMIRLVNGDNMKVQKVVVK